MHKIKDMLMKELMKYEEKGNISMNSLDVIHKMTDTIKNIDKIGMLEEGGGYSETMYSRDYLERGGRDGYSRDGEWEARGSYDRGDNRGNSYEGGSSYANRGQHYVRGHYSRDEYSNDGYSERRDSRGRYSRDESKDMMMRKFDEMLGEAKTPAERETIKKCIETMENY